MTIYDISVKKMDGTIISLAEFKDKVLLIVNTASRCGYTPQFAGLQEIYEKYKDKDFVVLGFPCNQFLRQDPGTNEEILDFCQINYGVTFLMFGKIEVRGKNRHELYDYLIAKSPDLTNKAIKWNFEKFLIDRSGDVVHRYVSRVSPKEIETDIEKLL